MGARHSLRMVCFPLVLTAALGASASAQSSVFIVEGEHQQNLPPFKPTNVSLEQRPLTPRMHRELLTAFTAEQGFARRPMPLDTHGLVLHANGELKPEGTDYEKMLQKGISAHAGDRMTISDVRIEPSRIVFEFNGGPDHKHKYLRHVSVGAGGGDMPLARDDGQEPVGSRLTVVFDKYVPEMTPDQLRALIQPVIDFSVKTPLEAYVDTLPPKLKEAILAHRVLVGMDRKMVVYALGSPQQKVREDNNGQPFEEWIYGEAPQPTQFVRFQGTHVIQVEIGAVGADLVVRNQDETGGYQSASPLHEVNLGDAKTKTEGDGARRTAPPSLRLPGEQLPGSAQPVQMPKPDSSQPAASTPAPQALPAPPTSSTGHLDRVDPSGA